MGALAALWLVLAADAFERRCVATDEEGAVLAEAVDDDALTCRERIKVQLRERECTAGRGAVSYRYQRGRGKASAAIVYCPGRPARMRVQRARI